MPKGCLGKLGAHQGIAWQGFFAVGESIVLRCTYLLDKIGEKIGLVDDLHLYYNADKAVEDGRKFNLRMMDLQQDEAKSRFGFFVLLSNEVKSSRIALEIYRNKDVVEKAFGNIKERLNGKRMLVSSDASLEGKLFVEFIALIYLSYIKKQMSEKNLFKQYTLQGLLDEADLIECYTRPGKSLTVAEVLHKQRQLFKDMDVLPPDAVASL